MLKLYVNLQTALRAMKEERGQDLVEYALLAALISVACISGMKPVATAINSVFAYIVTTLNAAT
jgi:pilus assembly protein Flp/PilA